MKTLKTLPDNKKLEGLSTKRLLNILKIARGEIKMIEKEIETVGFDAEKHKRIYDLKRIFEATKSLLETREHVA